MTWKTKIRLTNKFQMKLVTKDECAKMNLTFPVETLLPRQINDIRHLKTKLKHDSKKENHSPI